MKKTSELLLISGAWLILLTLFIFPACKHDDGDDEDGGDISIIIDQSDVVVTGKSYQFS